MTRPDPIKALIDLPEQSRQKIIAGLSPDQITAILYDWRIWARDNQIAPSGTWSTWLCLAGRGWGKTRTGAEWAKEQVERHGVRRLALVAPTASDAREVMIEGESGLLSVFAPGERPLYEPSKRRVTFRNGAIATAFSAEKPGRLRGPQHDAAWCDEVCVWQYDRETWDNLQFGLRLGRDPRVCVTTTPKPTALLKEIFADPSTVISKGSTYQNRANLAGSFLQRILRTYEGTRLGRQELHAEILEDIEGALWQRAWIEKHRVAKIAPRSAADRDRNRSRGDELSHIR